MKTRIATIIFLVGVIISSGFAQNKSSMDISFTALGNCYLCKLRIEEAVNNLTGIENVTWDYATKVTDVSYDDEIMDAFQIMLAIAAVGHDTEWYPAPDSAYNTLVGTCCEYPRTIDYINVEIGYLSLMGIWVYPLTGISDFEEVSCNVFPSISHGIFTIELGNNLKNTLNSLTMFSMNGHGVFETAINSGLRNSIDVSYLQKGKYIMILSGDQKVIAQKKVIIN